MTSRAVAGTAVLFCALLHVGCASDTRYSGSAGLAGAGGTAGGGTGGTAGAAGLAGAGGGQAGAAGATAGATGTAGATAGATGSAGATAGAAGSARGGAGGSVAGAGGGVAGSGAAGSGGGPTTTLKLEYATSSATATTFAVRITNTGPATPLISAIKARYFFNDDSGNKMNGATLDSATWHLSSAGSDVDVRASGGCAIISTFPAVPMSAYADIGCSLASPLNANDTLTFSLHFDPATQAAANDYSYLATAGTFQANSHMLLLQNGLIVAGTPPF